MKSTGRFVIAVVVLIIGFAARAQRYEQRNFEVGDVVERFQEAFRNPVILRVESVVTGSNGSAILARRETSHPESTLIITLNSQEILTIFLGHSSDAQPVCVSVRYDSVTGLVQRTKAFSPCKLHHPERPAEKPPQ